MAKSPTKTPMMQQFDDAKSAHPDAILLFRMGDFYELFHEDAKTAARVLGLSLTSREKGENGTPMAGFPHHQLEGYIGKLINAGFKVAVCDQVEDPKKAQGLVRREVTRVVTAGTLTDDSLLDPQKSNFLAAIAQGATTGIAWVELSTGRFQACTIPASRLGDELARIQPSECLISENSADSSDGNNHPVSNYFQQNMMISTRPAWAFAKSTADKILTEHFGTKTLEGFGWTDNDTPAICAAGAILDYLKETQRSSLDHLDRLIPYRLSGTVEIDEATRRSLEIVATMRDANRQGSLLGSLDQTVTAMGARMFADWLANPLTDIDSINSRLDAVEELVNDATLCDSLQQQLRQVYDLQRLLGRVATGRSSPRDLSFIGRTLQKLPALKAKLTSRKSGLLNRLEAEIDLCPDLRSQLDAALAEDCPLLIKDGGFIRSGFNEKLDAIRELAAGGKKWIAQYQSQQMESAGIPNLKVGYNKVFGYYLEVTNSHLDKVPEHFIRKQTLKNAERYITSELKDYEEKVIQADEQSQELEYELFCELRDCVAASSGRLRTTATIIAKIDALVSLATIARQRNYCRPTLEESSTLQILDARHPVLDILLPEGTFVPNDTICGAEDSQILVITGPNMAGKSTYIRQVALLALMAQVGSFVPARQAKIGIVDRIFARVGASDELSRGQSTFMVEMTETARILNNATSRSLVILDEIGRGTSTYDGLSIAWAVIEHLHDTLGCRTLFATHYHELTDLEKTHPGVKNLNVAVREWNEEVVFLHKIEEGAADKSYGIHVARLAGIPREVNQRAKQILSQLEEEHLDTDGRPKITRQRGKSKDQEIQLSLFGPSEHPLLAHLRSININDTTPLEALTQLKAFQEELQSETKAKPR